jgi:predicted anti-sigma-YlaC factor YlaD
MNAAPVPTIDPGIVAIVTGIITAVAGYAVAHVQKGATKVQKAAEVQEQINEAVSSLIRLYQSTIEAEKRRHADHVQELEDRIDRQEQRIHQLVAAMRAAGINIPEED